MIAILEIAEDAIGAVMDWGYDHLPLVLGAVVAAGLALIFLTGTSAGEVLVHFEPEGGCYVEHTETGWTSGGHVVTMPRRTMLSAPTCDELRRAR